MPASGRGKEKSHQWVYQASGAVVAWLLWGNCLLLIGFAVTLQQRAHAWSINLLMAREAMIFRREPVTVVWLNGLLSISFLNMYAYAHGLVLISAFISGQ